MWIPMAMWVHTPQLPCDPLNRLSAATQPPKTGLQQHCPSLKLAILFYVQFQLFSDR